MKKDIIIAIVFGFIFGAGSALLLTNLPTIIREGVKNTDQISLVTPTPIPAISNNLTLTIDWPTDDIVSNDKKISVSGKTIPNATLAIETDLESFVKEATGDGTFNQSINLQEGDNKIYITSYDTKGESINKTLQIYYSSEDL